MQHASMRIYNRRERKLHILALVLVVMRTLKRCTAKCLKMWISLVVAERESTYRLTPLFLLGFLLSLMFYNVTDNNFFLGGNTKKLKAKKYKMSRRRKFVVFVAPHLDFGVRKKEKEEILSHRAPPPPCNLITHHFYDIT